MDEFTDNNVTTADYVVVGTGSAGSIVAERLSADPAKHVVVLEAGGKDTDRRIRMPVTWTQLFRSPIDWDYLTEPQPELNGRQLLLAPRKNPGWLLVDERHDVDPRLRRRLRRMRRTLRRTVVFQRHRQILQANRKR